MQDGRFFTILEYFADFFKKTLTNSNKTVIILSRQHYRFKYGITKHVGFPTSQCVKEQLAFLRVFSLFLYIWKIYFKNT